MHGRREREEVVDRKRLLGSFPSLLIFPLVPCDFPSSSSPTPSSSPRPAAPCPRALPPLERTSLGLSHYPQDTPCICLDCEAGPTPLSPQGRQLHGKRRRDSLNEIPFNTPSSHTLLAQQTSKKRLQSLGTQGQQILCTAERPTSSQTAAGPLSAPPPVVVPIFYLPKTSTGS